MTKRTVCFGALVCALVLPPVALASPEPGETPNLAPDRVTQEEIETSQAGLDEVRLAGLRMFTTLFNKLDGYGDGPMDPSDPVSPGGRPTLQGNGTFLRVNGLDGQGCIECHSTVSAATVPPRLGIGGIGGSNSNAMFGTTLIDMDNPELDGTLVFNGRFINPPFLFGAGAVELLAQEMTLDLQIQKALALTSPGAMIALQSKGVSFGTIVADSDGNLDTSGVEGVSDDLVVRPFGRKGEFFSIRDFDIGAMQFHFGMQPVEVVGADYDADGDGVENEVLPGDLSALSAFLATLEPPVKEPLDLQGQQGFAQFQQLGCVNCHKPLLQTKDEYLRLRFPEVATDPYQNVFMQIDLSAEPTSFPENSLGGISVPLFADLKRHDMGPDLAEDFDLVDEQTNREFTTARLWGVADTAPYLHDGRATTLTEAILAHGGEAQAARDAFEALDDEGRIQVLTFLRSLRTPADPARDLVDGDDDENDDVMGDGSDSAEGHNDAGFTEDSVGFVQN